MRLAVAAIIAAALTATASAARADTFVVAGYSFPSPAPFQVLAAKDDVCAPAATALRRIGVELSVSGKTIALRAPDGSWVIGQLGSERIKVGGVELNLPAAPTQRGPNLYLPMRAIAWHLGLACRWDEQSRTIYLHPKISGIAVARLSDKVRVKISGSARLSYSAGALKDPARIYVDVANADLFAAEQQIAAGEGDLTGIRANQHCVNPDLVRVVLDLKAEHADYSHALTDGGRSIVVDIPAPSLPQPPLAGAGKVVTVFALRLESRSDNICRLVVEANGAPVASLHTRSDPPQVIIDLSNVALGASNPNPPKVEPGVPLLPQTKANPSDGALPAPPAAASDTPPASPAVAKPEITGAHRLVKLATIEQTGEGQAQIVLELTRPEPAVLARRARGLAVLIGEAALSEMSIVLDPGHGGRQPGAIGPSGLEEKGINLAVASRAQQLLQERGADVVLTRRGDSSLIPVTCREELRRELTMRAEVANQRRADVFVAIHCNSSPHGAPRRSGTETYYCTPRSIGLATVMQQEMLKGLGLNDGGTHAADFVVIRCAQMPAVLVELAYLNNATEESLLGSPEFRERAARAIVSGLQRFAEEGGLLNYYAELERKAAAVVAQQPPRAGVNGAQDELSVDPPKPRRPPTAARGAGR